MLLAEIGEAGQRRLGAATAAVAGDGLAHEIAVSYATRAGIGRVVPGSIDERALAPSFVENSATRAMVTGSRSALAALRDALVMSRPVQLVPEASPVSRDSIKLCYRMR
jgi:hypothetical protein